MEFKTNINSKDYLDIQFETVVHLRAWGLEGAILSRTGGISNHLEISWEIQFKNVPAPFWSAGPPPPAFWSNVFKGHRGDSAQVSVWRHMTGTQSCELGFFQYH